MHPTTIRSHSALSQTAMILIDRALELAATGRLGEEAARAIGGAACTALIVANDPRYTAAQRRGVAALMRDAIERYPLARPLAAFATLSALPNQ